MPPAPPPVVAIINTSPDVVDLLRHAFQPTGIMTVSAMTHDIRAGIVDLEAFIRQHRPAVVIYDIAPPYDANWQLFLHIRASQNLRGLTFVLTSTNVAHVEKLAGNDQTIYEIVGKPYDLGKIVQATKEALRSRPSR